MSKYVIKKKICIIRVPSEYTENYNVLSSLLLYREGAALYPFERARLTASDVLPDVSNKPGNSTRQPESSTATHGSARQDSGRTKFSSQ